MSGPKAMETDAKGARGSSPWRSCTRDNMPETDRAQLHFCSFCGKSQDEVRHLIHARNEVFICEECVDLCSDILADSSGNETAESAAASVHPILLCGLCRLPVDAGQGLSVPDRGFLCGVCIDAIKAVLDRTEG